jgi:hypothetical protein
MSGQILPTTYSLSIAYKRCQDEKRGPVMSRMKAAASLPRMMHGLAATLDLIDRSSIAHLRAALVNMGGLTRWPWSIQFPLAASDAVLLLPLLIALGAGWPLLIGPVRHALCRWLTRKWKVILSMGYSVGLILVGAALVLRNPTAASCALESGFLVDFFLRCGRLTKLGRRARSRTARGQVSDTASRPMLPGTQERSRRGHSANRGRARD